MVKIWIDLYGPFKSFSHDQSQFTIGKTKNIWFFWPSSTFIQRYLCSRFRRSIIKCSFCNWNEVITWVHQSSILGPLLLFKVMYSWMIIYRLSWNVSYATMSMTTFYHSGKIMKKNNNDLELEFIILHKWFHDNYMVLNPGKCLYIVIGVNDPSHKINLNNKKNH